MTLMILIIIFIENLFIKKKFVNSKHSNGWTNKMNQVLPAHTVCGTSIPMNCSHGNGDVQCNSSKHRTLGEIFDVQTRRIYWIWINRKYLDSSNRVSECDLIMQGIGFQWPCCRWVLFSVSFTHFKIPSSTRMSSVVFFLSSVCFWKNECKINGSVSPWDVLCIWWNKICKIECVINYIDIIVVIIL